ncbi:Maltase 1 [Orchesella cincta]|uniref:alpha-glucosidase n=1 Tax=Orchesella cincta TaxID=48709 RepID=A0A1D2N863_ORCCI|nr:Maltase 1 [Orchesella cincta]
MALLPTLILCLSILSPSIVAVKIPQDPNPQPLSWWKEEVIYQIYPRSHQDSDGDGIGDLEGIISRLDHFVELGIGAVWLSPIYKSPMKDMGYDISNFTDIEPVFGTIETFKRMAAGLKERGIRLVMDFVPNHSSDQHPWFNMSAQRIEPYTEYYVWKDPSGFDDEGKPIPPNNWVSLFGGSMWEYNEVRGQFYLHQFLKEQPDLNFESRQLRNEILAVFKIWLDYGVDGFRVDAVPHLFEDQEFPDEEENPNRPPEIPETDYAYWMHRHTYNLPGVFDALAEMRQLLDIYTLSDGKERVMMVEATVAPPALFEYYGTKEKPIAHFPFNFDLIGIPSGYNAENVERVMSLWYNNLPEGAWANMLSSNHDNKRVPSRYTEEAIDFFNMMVLLLPANAVSYYGEEIGMSNANISWEDTTDEFACAAGPDRYHLFSRDPSRTPMQWDDSDKAGFSTANKTWLPVHPDYVDVNVAAQKASTGNTHLSIYKRLMQLRHTDVWRYGSLETNSIEENKVFGFSRIFNDKGFIVLSNTVDEAVTVNAATQFEGIPATATVYVVSVGFQPETAVGSSVSTNSIVIGPKHSIVVEF